MRSCSWPTSGKLGKKWGAHFVLSKNCLNAQVLIRPLLIAKNKAFFGQKCAKSAPFCLVFVPCTETNYRIHLIWRDLQRSHFHPSAGRLRANAPHCLIGAGPVSISRVSRASRCGAWRRGKGRRAREGRVRVRRRLSSGGRGRCRSWRSSWPGCRGR